MKMIRITNLFILSGLVMAMAFLTSCGSGDKAEMSSDAAAGADAHVSAGLAASASVEWGVPLRMKLSQPLRVTASVEVPPQSLASVHSPVAGYVQTLRYLPGDHVRKGTLLCTLTHPELVRLQRDYLEARARLKFLESEKARKEQLAAVDAASRRTFE
ncbi:MAG: biotin/lipoyl-binding protein, partial [Bacteroidetes bacterium]